MNASTKKRQDIDEKKRWKREKVFLFSLRRSRKIGPFPTEKGKHDFFSMVLSSCMMLKHAYGACYPHRYYSRNTNLISRTDEGRKGFPMRYIASSWIDPQGEEESIKRIVQREGREKRHAANYRKKRDSLFLWCRQTIDNKTEIPFLWRLWGASHRKGKSGESVIRFGLRDSRNNPQCSTHAIWLKGRIDFVIDHEFSNNPGSRYPHNNI